MPYIWYIILESNFLPDLPDPSLQDVNGAKENLIMSFHISVHCQVNFGSISQMNYVMGRSHQITSDGHRMDIR